MNALRRSFPLAVCFGMFSCALLGTGCGSGGSSSDETGTGGAAGEGGETAGTGGTSGAAGMTGSHGSGGSSAGGAPGQGSGGASGTQGGQTGGHAGTGAAGAGGHSATTGTGGESGAAGHAASGGSGGRAGAAGQPGAGGAAGMGPEAPAETVSGYGFVLFTINARDEIVRLQTTMTVPLEPPASGTLFLWPGLQPDGANFDPINNGVLQPVLTWGGSCAPGDQPRDYATWWISAQYVNTYGNDPGYTGCQGGAVMSVAVGDQLTIDMALSGTVWTQTITDVQSGKTVSYSIDMMDQAQNLALFDIEEYSSAPVSEVLFTDTTITYGSADSADCKLNTRGQTDYVSVPVPSGDGLSCAIQEIILRAQGIQ